MRDTVYSNQIKYLVLCTQYIRLCEFLLIFPLLRMLLTCLHLYTAINFSHAVCVVHDDDYYDTHSL